jgi:hypothetical protein
VENAQFNMLFSFLFQLGRYIGKPANARPVGDMDSLSDRVAGLGRDVSLSLYLFCPVLSCCCL